MNEETGELGRVGGVRYTIKDGIVYDAKKLLEDVRKMVADQKAEMRITTDSGGSRCNSRWKMRSSWGVLSGPGSSQPRLPATCQASTCRHAPCIAVMLPGNAAATFARLLHQ